MIESILQVNPFKEIMIRFLIPTKSADREGEARDDVDGVEKVWLQSTL